MGPDALVLTGVGVAREGRPILRDVHWHVGRGEHWVVLGSNGSGKSTLLRIAALDLHPSTGTVDVLGERLGRTDVRLLRRRIGYASAALADSLRPSISAFDVVLTARRGALEPWWHTYDDEDRDRAGAGLARLGMAGLAARPFGTLSSGERQRVLIARTLVNDVGIVLLDEPNAGLDLGGREWLVAGLQELAEDPATPPMVLVTHHVEEIPPAFERALLLRDGRTVAAGPTGEVLTSELLSATYGLPLEVSERDGRFTARAVARGPGRHLRHQAATAPLDLVAQQPLHEWCQRTAGVPQRHRQVAAGGPRVQGGVQHPGGVVPSVQLGPLEAHHPIDLVNGAGHPKTLRAGDRTEPGSEVDGPDRVVRPRPGLGIGSAHDVEPGRVAAEVGDPREDGGGGVRDLQPGGHLHGAQCPGPRRTTTGQGA
jgi:iron complex transport system ATP-binding protein